MYKLLYASIIFINLTLIVNAGAETMILDDFKSDRQSQWNYISDQVMGGVSEGNLLFDHDQQEHYAQLKGQVSTKNNGGFIQFRTDLKRMDKNSYQGIYAKVKGNNQKYYIHLRTKWTILPWQYYQSEFIADNEWHIVKLPIESFTPSSKWLKSRIGVKNIRSLGMVAFGRDHNADLRVSEIGFY